MYRDDSAPQARGGYVRLKAVQTQVIEKAFQSDEERLQALADRQIPKVRAAIMAAFDQIRSSVRMQDLIDALESGNIVEAMYILDQSVEVGAQTILRNALQDTLWAAGAAATAGINATYRGAQIEFNRVAPPVVNWLEEYDLDLIKRINDVTKEEIRSSLKEGVLAGAGPRETARDVRQSIGLLPSQRRAVANFRRELERFHERPSAKGYNLGAPISRAPGGAQVLALNPDGSIKDGITERRLRDFRYDRTLQRAMDSGKKLSRDQINRMTAAYARKYLKYRSETIATTETMRALNAGVFEAWRQAIDSGRVRAEAIRRRWIVAKDERLCKNCEPVPGLNPDGVGWGQPFRTPVGPSMSPPLHPRCRCVTYIRA